jgi:hypothetical protein
MSNGLASMGSTLRHSMYEGNLCVSTKRFGSPALRRLLCAALCTQFSRIWGDEINRDVFAVAAKSLFAQLNRRSSEGGSY